MSERLMRYATWLLMLSQLVQAAQCTEATHTCGCAGLDAALPSSQHEPQPVVFDHARHLVRDHASALPPKCTGSPIPTIEYAFTESAFPAGLACRGRASNSQSQSRSECCSTFDGYMPPAPLNTKLPQLIESQSLSHDFCSLLNSAQKDRLEVFCRVFGGTGLQCEPLVGIARSAADKAALSAGSEVAQGRARWRRARLYHLMRQVYLDAELLKNEADVVRDAQRAFGVVKDLTPDAFHEIQPASDRVWEHVQRIALMRAESSPTAARRQRWTAADLRYAGCERLILPLIDEDLSDPAIADLLRATSNTYPPRLHDNGATPGQAAPVIVAVSGQMGEALPPTLMEPTGTAADSDAIRFAEHTTEATRDAQKGRQEWQRSISRGLWALLVVLAVPTAGLLAVASVVLSSPRLPPADLRKQLSDARASPEKAARTRRHSRRQRKKAHNSLAKCESTAAASPQRFHTAPADEAIPAGTDPRSSNADGDGSDSELPPSTGPLAEAAVGAAELATSPSVPVPSCDDSCQTVPQGPADSPRQQPLRLKKATHRSVDTSCSTSVSSAFGPTTPAKTPILPLSCSHDDSSSSEASYPSTPTPQSPSSAAAHALGHNDAQSPLTVESPAAESDRCHPRPIRTPAPLPANHDRRNQRQPAKPMHNRPFTQANTQANSQTNALAKPQADPRANPQANLTPKRQGTVVAAPESFTVAKKHSDRKSFAVVTAGQPSRCKQVSPVSSAPTQKPSNTWRQSPKNDSIHKISQMRAKQAPTKTSDSRPAGWTPQTHAMPSTQQGPPPPNTRLESQQANPPQRPSDDIDVLLADAWAFTAVPNTSTQVDSFPATAAESTPPPLRLLKSKSGRSLPPCSPSPPAQLQGGFNPVSKCQSTYEYSAVVRMRVTSSPLDNTSKADSCGSFKALSDTDHCAHDCSLKHHESYTSLYGVIGGYSPTTHSAQSHQNTSKSSYVEATRAFDHKSPSVPHRLNSPQVLLPPLRKVSVGWGHSTQYDLWGRGGLPTCSYGTTSMPVSPLVCCSLDAASPSTTALDSPAPFLPPATFGGGHPWDQQRSVATTLRSSKSLGSTVSESTSESALWSSLRPNTPAFVPATSAAFSPASCPAIGPRPRDAATYVGGNAACMRSSLLPSNSIVIDEALGLLMSDVDPMACDTPGGSGAWASGNDSATHLRKCGKCTAALPTNGSVASGGVSPGIMGNYCRQCQVKL